MARAPLRFLIVGPSEDSNHPVGPNSRKAAGALWLDDAGLPGTLMLSDRQHTLVDLTLADPGELVEVAEGLGDADHEFRPVV
jgi:hypothetical protein